MKKIILPFYFLASSFAYCQEKDSEQNIAEIQLDAYKKPVSLFASTKSVGIISQELFSLTTPERLLEAVNQMPGARLEERSPGSYRIALRGSSLRSPFGVRNIKVYLDDFILSDASGNTYFNVLSPALIKKIELYKGPESGDFGAVTGGTLLLQTENAARADAHLSVGSYGTFNEHLHFSKQIKKHFLHIFQNYYQTDSYREQTAVGRQQFFIKDHFSYAPKADLKMMFLLTDLQYETPGGLTLEQMQANRRQARPATKTVLGALEQDAGIRNKMILAGVSHEIHITPELSHFALVQASYVDFKNPFITNFEKRFEHNIALRTHLNFEKTKGNFFWQWRLGYEGAKNEVVIRNFDNNRGIAGNAQNFDALENRSGFYFFSQKLNFKQKFFTDISVSLNQNAYRWERTFPDPFSGSKNFDNQLLPNFGLTYLWNSRWSLRAKVGKGNSAPTNEEIRSSTQQFNADLSPEFGWNKEVGIRKQVGNYFFAEANYFDFRLKNAIVRRQNERGQDFFVNAGATVQKGFEIVLESSKFQIAEYLSLKARLSGMFYDFVFKNYQQNSADLSGNEVTGVPKTTLNSLISFWIYKKFTVDYSHYYSSKIPLNDANTVWSEPSLLSNLQFRFPVSLEKNTLSLFFQIQNLYNEDLVLGFDINAFGNRFYNPSAKRNFIFGASFSF